MERVHRLFAPYESELRRVLDSVGAKYRRDVTPYSDDILALIPESDPAWPKLAPRLEALDESTLVELKFTRKEILAAEWCHMVANAHIGYPQPEDTWESSTYEPGTVCAACHVGRVQVAPFRFSRTPEARGSQVAQLNWVYDEFFFSEGARNDVEAAGLTGVRFDQPVLNRRGSPVAGWLQARVDSLSPWPTDVSRGERLLCPSCGATKYCMPDHEVMELRAGRAHAVPDVLKTVEWFGCSPVAARAVLVSQRFVHLALAKKWRGVRFEPVSFVEARD